MRWSQSFLTWLLFTEMNESCWQQTGEAGHSKGCNNRWPPPKLHHGRNSGKASYTFQHTTNWMVKINVTSKSSAVQYQSVIHHAKNIVFQLLHYVFFNPHHRGKDDKDLACCKIFLEIELVKSGEAIFMKHTLHGKFVTVNTEKKHNEK